MTITLGDISIRYVCLLLETAEELGFSSKDLCDQFNLSDHIISQADARISIPKYMRMGHTVIERINKPDFGFALGKKAQASLLGLAGMLASIAPTVKQSLQDIAYFESLSSKNARGHSRFYIEHETGIAEFYSISPYNSFNYFIVEQALVTQAQLVNEFSWQPVQPTLVQVEFPEPSYSNVYADYFQCPVKFDQPRNALTFHKNDLERRTKLSNQLTYADLRSICIDRLKAAERELTLQERVMNAISPLLQTNDLTLDHVSAQLEMPAWTLRRKLQTEGTSFKTLIDETRQSLALIYVRDAHYSIGEIAYLLGFAHPNAFQRAFKRWTGHPPGTYRMNLSL